MNHQIGYYGGASNVMQQQQNLSHFSTGYTTPNDVSGILTPDLDLPLDFSDFNEFPVTDSLHGFAGHSSNV